METPTISKKQSKKTLSGKKKKVEVIKNVLAQPYQTYWPLLTPEDDKVLVTNLNKLLPRLKPTKASIPYEKIKTIPKHERKKYRENQCAKNEKINEGDKNFLVFGVNSVTQLLEKQQVGAILIANQVKPRLIVQHILDQAVLYNIPILVVDNLKPICHKQCGLSGVAVAIHKSVPADTHLALLQQTIANLHENYAVQAQNHININRKLDSTTITIPDSDIDDSVVFLSETHDENTSEILFLKRIEGKRAFIPPKAPENGIVIDLIEAPSNKQPTNNNNYQHVQIKRFKGDKNRDKRKIQSNLKRKRK